MEAQKTPHESRKKTIKFSSKKNLLPPCGFIPDGFSPETSQEEETVPNVLDMNVSAKLIYSA